MREELAEVGGYKMLGLVRHGWAVATGTMSICNDAAARVKPWRKVYRILSAVTLAVMMFVAWTVYRPVTFDASGFGIFLGGDPLVRGEGWVGGFIGSSDSSAGEAVVWIGSICYRVSYSKIYLVA